MKVVVQNGVSHCLRRADAEAVLQILPHSWHTSIRQVVLAQGAALTTSFHPKEKLFYLYCGSGFRDKDAAVTTLVKGLAKALDCGVPEGLEAKCIEAVHAQSPNKSFKPNPLRGSA